MSQACLTVPKRKKSKRKRGDDGDNEEEDEVDFGTVDIQSMDASAYLAAVSNQARKMPEFFESAPTDDTASATKEEEERPQSGSTRSKERVTPIDGSAASLQYLISPRASITPLPSQLYLPRNPNWVDGTLQNFEKLRQYLKECKKLGVGGKLTRRWRVPPMKDRPGWHIFCVGENEAHGNEDDYFGDDDNDNGAATGAAASSSASGNTQQQAGGTCATHMPNGTASSDMVPDQPAWMADLPKDGHHPTVALLLQLDAVLNRRVLSHMCHFVQLGWEAGREKRAMWLYSLLARLETPIHRDDAATLYGLLKALTLERSKLKLVAKADGGHDDDHGSEQEREQRNKLASINTLIVIVGLYFGQSDRMTIMGSTAKGASE